MQFGMIRKIRVMSISLCVFAAFLMLSVIVRGQETVDVQIPEIVQPQKEATATITSVSDDIYIYEDELKDKKIGIQDGAVYEPKFVKMFPNSQIVNYTEYTELITATKNGRLDCYVVDILSANYQIKDMPGLYFLDDTVTRDDYAFLLNPNDKTFTLSVDQTLEEMRSDGTIDVLEKKWSVPNEDNFSYSNPLPNPEGVIRVAVCADQQPFAFVKQDKIIGFEIDIISEIAKRLNCEVTFTNLPFDSVTAGVMTGNFDIGAGCAQPTEEKKQVIGFSTPFYTGKTVVMKYDEKLINTSIWESLIASFKRTFVVEKRWKMIVDGLLVTCYVSIVTMLLGTLFGFGFSFLIRSKNRFISRLSSVCSTLLDSMPILIVLLIFYYIIFSKTDLSAMWIGILAMTLDFGNTVSSILVNGIEQTDKGEIEAAITMGYSKTQIFTKIIMPQVAKKMSFQYNNAVVTLIKGTSVIGYITIQDLTKAGDLIRTRTYEAFFPLIVIALIYFVIEYLFVLLLKQVQNHFDPKRRPRVVKGVMMHD